MRAEQINRASGVGLVILSLTALLMVVTAALRVLLSGQIAPPATDEGTSARIFQLLMVALLPVGVLFLVTADWTQPVRMVRRLALPATAVFVAFAVLYYFEHYLQRV